jgi:hypothetical protein
MSALDASEAWAFVEDLLELIERRSLAPPVRGYVWESSDDETMRDARAFLKQYRDATTTQATLFDKGAKQ